LPRDASSGADLSSLGPGLLTCRTSVQSVKRRTVCVKCNGSLVIGQCWLVGLPGLMPEPIFYIGRWITSGTYPGQNDLVIAIRDIAATCEASNRRRGVKLTDTRPTDFVNERRSASGPTAGRSHPLVSTPETLLFFKQLPHAARCRLAGRLTSQQHCARTAAAATGIRSSCRSMRKMFPGATAAYPGPVRRSRHFAGRTHVQFGRETLLAES